MENKFSVNENHIYIYGDEPPIEAGLKEATLRGQKRVAIEYYKEYQHIGFKIIGKDDCDGDGKAYPILHMQL